MIATEGIHYNICSRPGSTFRWREYTLRGEKELTMFQKWRIDAAFMAGKLGSEFVFNEPNPYISVEEYLDKAERIGAQKKSQTKEATE